MHEAHHIATSNFLWILVKSEHYLRSALFCECTQCRKVVVIDVSAQPVGPISKCQAVQSWTFVTNSKSTLYNILEEHRSHFHRGESPKSRNSNFLSHFFRVIAVGYPLSTTAVMADSSNAQGHDKRDILCCRQLSTLRITVNISIWTNARISDQRCSTCSQDQLSSFLTGLLWKLDGQG